MIRNPKNKSLFARFFRLKRKAPGLSIIVGLGALHCIAAAALIAELPDWRAHIGVLIVPLSYTLSLTVTAFVLIKQAERNPSPLLGFFHDFNIWKGLAVVGIAPAVAFWIQLFRNYHYTLDIAGAFVTILVLHAVMTLFALLFFIIVCANNAWRRIVKRNASRVRKSRISMEDWVPNLTLMRVFFRSTASTPLGVALSALVGGAYLAFLYLSIASLLVPQSMLVKTDGTVASANTVAVMFAGKYGSHRQQYCLLTVQSAAGVSKFALRNCLPCMRTEGTPVVVEHNPIDYFSRRSNSAQCLVPKPSAI
jgi:hypothetical protein